MPVGLGPSDISPGVTVVGTQTIRPPNVVRRNRRTKILSRFCEVPPPMGYSRNDPVGLQRPLIPKGAGGRARPPLSPHVVEVVRHFAEMVLIGWHEVGARVRIGGSGCRRRRRCSRNGGCL